MHTVRPLILILAALYSSLCQAEPSYNDRLSEHLQRFKNVPAAAKRLTSPARVLVRFTVDKDGKISESAIVDSSGVAELDQEGLTMLQRAQPLPPFSPDMPPTRTFTLPIRFDSRTPRPDTISKEAKLKGVATERLKCRIEGDRNICRADGVAFVWCKTEPDLTRLETEAFRGEGGKTKALADAEKSKSCGTTEAFVLNRVAKPEATIEGIGHPAISKTLFVAMSPEVRFLTGENCNGDGFCAIKSGMNAWACPNASDLFLIDNSLKEKGGCRQFSEGNTFAITKSTEPSTYLARIPSRNASSTLRIKPDDLVDVRFEIPALSIRRPWCKLGDWCFSIAATVFCKEKPPFERVQAAPAGEARRTAITAERDCRLVAPGNPFQVSYGTGSEKIISIEHPVYGTGWVSADAFSQLSEDVPLKWTTRMGDVSVLMGKAPIVRAVALKGQGSAEAAGIFRSGADDRLEFCSAFYGDDRPRVAGCMRDTPSEQMQAMANCANKVLQFDRRTLKLVERPKDLPTDKHIDKDRAWLWRDLIDDTWIDGTSASAEPTMDSLFNALCPGEHPEAALSIVVRDARAQYPTEMRGSWILEGKNCGEFLRDPKNYVGEDLMRISSTEMDSYEYHERINLIRKTSTSGWSIDSSWEAEGSRGQATTSYELRRDGLYVTSNNTTRRWRTCGARQ